MSLHLANLVSTWNLAVSVSVFVPAGLDCFEGFLVDYDEPCQVQDLPRSRGDHPFEDAEPIRKVKQKSSSLYSCPDPPSQSCQYQKPAQSKFKCPQRARPPLHAIKAVETSRQSANRQCELESMSIPAAPRHELRTGESSAALILPLSIASSAFSGGFTTQVHARLLSLYPQSIRGKQNDVILPESQHIQQFLKLCHILQCPLNKRIVRGILFQGHRLKNQNDILLNSKSKIDWGGLTERGKLLAAQSVLLIKGVLNCLCLL